MKVERFPGFGQVLRNMDRDKLINENFLIRITIPRDNIICQINNNLTRRAEEIESLLTSLPEKGENNEPSN